MEKRFVLENGQIPTEFDKKFKNFLNKKYNYNDNLSKLITEAVKDLSVIYGIEHTQAICDAITSCKYEEKKITSGIPEYKSSPVYGNDGNLELDENENVKVSRVIKLPANAEYPHNLANIIRASISLINSCVNEYTLNDDKLTKRRGLERTITTGENSHIRGKEMQQGIENYIFLSTMNDWVMPDYVKLEESSEPTLIAGNLLKNDYIGDTLFGALVTSNEDDLSQKFETVHNGGLENFLETVDRTAKEGLESDKKVILELLNKVKSYSVSQPEHQKTM